MSPILPHTRELVKDTGECWEGGRGNSTGGQAQLMCESGGGNSPGGRHSSWCESGGGHSPRGEAQLMV